MSQRISIQYSISLDELEEEVQRLLEKSFNKISNLSDVKISSRLSLGAIEDIDEVIEWYKRERDAIDRKFNSNSKKGGNFSGSAPKSVKADGLPDKEERFEAIGVVGHNKEEFEQVAREKDALPVDYKKAAEKLKKELKKDTLETKDLIKMHE